MSIVLYIVANEQPNKRARLKTATAAIIRFYVYDDGGSGPTPASDVLQDYIQAGVVVYKDVHQSVHRKGFQTRQYSRCVDQTRHRHKWLAFIDVDEFIVIDDPTKTIPDMLSNYTQYGGVGE
jgi:Glycosyltransferase family 92